MELQAQSIWMPGVSLSIFQTNNKHLTDDCANIDRPSTKGKEVIIKGPVLKDKVRPTQKRIRQGNCWRKGRILCCVYMDVYAHVCVQCGCVCAREMTR